MKTANKFFLKLKIETIRNSIRPNGRKTRPKCKKTTKT